MGAGEEERAEGEKRAGAGEGNAHPSGQAPAERYALSSALCEHCEPLAFPARRWLVGAVYYDLPP